MPQLDIKDIELFHRNDYPATKTRLSAGDVIETISIIIDPKFTDKENKVDDFFTIKPRRFEFAVRKSDYTFFNVAESPLLPHTNYPNLSDYMIRVFNSSDAIIFEGILSIENTYEYNSQTISLLAYDPLVLFADSELSYTTADLQTNYTAPKSLAALLFGTTSTRVIGKYFTASSYFPDYDNTWTEHDFDLAAYQTLHDWDDTISNGSDGFYDLATGAWKNAADNYFGSPGMTTDIFDYSKLEVFRGRDFKTSCGFLFIGCIVYHDSVNNKNYAKVWWRGGYFNFNDGLPHDLPENITLANAKTYNATNSPIDTYGHRICKYYSNRIYHKFYLLVYGNPFPYYDTDTNIFDPVAWAKDFTDNAPSLIDFITPDMKAMINLRDTFQWKPLSFTDEDVEYLGNAGDTSEIVEDLYTNQVYYDAQMSKFKNAFLMLNEGGEAQYSISDNVVDADYLYNMNNEAVLSLYNYPASPVVTEVEPDNEEGLFDFWYFASYQGWYSTYKFKIQYLPYPETYTTFGLADVDKLHKIGNISRKLNQIPTDVSYAKYYAGGGSNNYDFKIPETGETFVGVASLIKMLLATMNLYLYYDNCTITLIPTGTFASSAIVIADSDVIDWEAGTGEKKSIDCTDKVSMLDNYTPQILNPYYNSLVAVDNITASCKVSRRFNEYSLDLNYIVTILGYNWRVEKINKTKAYYDLRLTKYTEVPT